MGLDGLFTGSFPATFRYWVFDISANRWVGPADHIFEGEAGGFPNDPPHTTTRDPIGGQASQGGAGNAQQGNPVQAYRLLLEYDYVTSADLTAILLDYESNKTVERTLAYQGDDYLVTYGGSIKIIEASPVTKKVTITLNAQKQ